MLPVAAFVGGSIAVMLTYAVGRSARRERDAATLILAGVTVTAFFTAWQTFVQQQNSETLQEVYSWILGNIPSSGWSDVVLILPYLAVAMVVILALRRVVDVLNLGDDEAASLGVDVKRVRLALVVAATLGTAAAVAVTGLIGFVGIIVPHTIRLLTGVGYRALIPLSVVVGCRVPRARGCHRAYGARARRDPARRGDRVLRRAVLRARPAHDAGRSGVIDLRAVTVELGGKPVVDRVDAVVADGEWLALIGPNGAGKTTLLRAIARLVPFTGEIALAGRSVDDLPRAELARLVAVVPQEPSTPPWMTVAEYVLLGRTPHLGPLAKEGARDRAAAARSLARLDLLPFADRRLGTLSGGEKQRVVVARAIAQEARIVLLDEPTAALDIGHQQQALELLDGLREESGLTLVAAMHDLTLAAQYADRMLLLDAGRVVADGPPADVLTEALIATHYGASIDVVQWKTGSPSCRAESRRAIRSPSRRCAWSVPRSEAVCDRVARLVHEDVARAGEFEARPQAEAHVFDRAREPRPLRLELGHRGGDVVAHERDRVMARVGVLLAFPRIRGGVHAELARPGLEDEPTGRRLGVLEVRPAQHVAEELARRDRVVRVDQRVDGFDHR